MLMFIRYVLGCSALASMATLTPIATAASIVLVPARRIPISPGCRPVRAPAEGRTPLRLNLPRRSSASISRPGRP